MEKTHCRISVQVIPRSSRISIALLGGASFKIKLTCPPVEGAANGQLVQVLSDRLSIPKSGIEIASGKQRRRKIVKIHGLDETTVTRLLTGDTR